jgi:hypothetical protein
MTNPSLKTILKTVTVALVLFTATPRHLLARPANSARQGAAAATKTSTSAAASENAQDSVVEAARKARTQKDNASKPARVVTDEDVHNLKGPVSVVGMAEPSASHTSAKSAEPSDKPAEANATTEQKGAAVAEESGQKDQKEQDAKDQNDQNGGPNHQNGDQNEQNDHGAQNGGGGQADGGGQSGAQSGGGQAGAGGGGDN